MKHRVSVKRVFSLFMAVCLTFQVVGQVIAIDPYFLPSADPRDPKSDSYQPNGLESTIPFEQFEGEKPPLTLPEQASSVDELVPSHLTLINAISSESKNSETETSIITPDGAAVSFLDGKVVVIADTGSFTEDTIVNLISLPTISVEKTSFSNEADGAYFNDEGDIIGMAGEDNELIRFKLEAISVNSKQPIDTFGKGVHVVVDLRSFGDLPENHDWYLYYQDENSPTAWESNGIVVHDEAGLLSTSVQQFSEMRGGAEIIPVSWRFNWMAPTVSAFSGAATYHYPIEVPPGRAGLTPNIDIFYNSRALDSLILSPQDQGELGLGWTINNIKITRSKSSVSGICCPGTNGGHTFGLEHYPNFSLSLNGQNYELRLFSPSSLPPNATEAQFIAINGPGILIKQIYDTNLQTHDKVYWIVKTPDGATYTLGSKANSERGQWVSGTGAEYNHSDGTHELLGADLNYGPTSWLIDKVVDVHGNRIEYSYYKSQINQSWNGSELHTEYGRLSEILYNFDFSTIPDTPASKIVFLRNAGNFDRIYEIELYHRGDHTNFDKPYREIEIGLGSTNDISCGQPIRTNYVSGIQVKKQQPDNSYLYLPETTMTTIQLGHAWPENGTGANCFRYQYLKTVDNGYGGKVEFVYAPGDGDDRKSCDSPCNDVIPEYGYSFPVIQTKTFDRTWDGSASPAITDYIFTDACYDQTSGELGDWDGTSTNCPAMTDESGYYPNGTLMGFENATVIYRDYDDQVILSKAVYNFHKDARKMGQPTEQQLRNADDFTLQKKTYTYTEDAGFLFTYVSSESTFVYVPGGPNPEGEVTQYKIDYDYDRQNNVQYGNLTYIHEYGSLAVTTDDRHIYRGYYPNTTQWIVGLPAWETILDSNSALQTATTNYYDNQACYTCAPGTKGNLTKVRRTVDPVAPTYITTQQLQYDAYGNVTGITDGLNHTTVTEYDATYNLLPVEITSPATAPGPSYHVQTFKYYGFNDTLPSGYQAGLLSQTIDPNGVVTEYTYDPFYRLQRVMNDVLNGSTGDTVSSPGEFYLYYDFYPIDHTNGPFLITSWQKTQNDALADSPGGIYQREFFDGLGRTIQTQRQFNDWSGGSTGQRIITDISYNAAGQAVWQSVPYLKPSVTSLPSNPYLSPDLTQDRITNQYDAAGQLVRSVGLDDAVTSQIYGRQAVYTQDANNHLQTSFFDGYNRSLAIDEMINTFTEDFSDLSSWTVNGNAYVSNGEAYLSGNGTSISHNLSDTQDKSVILSFNSADPNLDALIRLSYGGGSATRQWGLSIDGGELQLYKKVGGTITYTPLMDFEANTWYRLALRTSKANTRGFAILVWEEDNPDNIAEFRATQDSSWYNNNWNFRAAIYSAGAALKLDNYEELNVNRTSYTYDALGNLKTVIDPLGYTTSMTYDGLSRKIAMTDPDMGAWTYGYDNAGNLTTQTDSASHTITFTYDELNRLTGKWYNSIEYAHYSYDAGTYGIGHRTGMTSTTTTTGLFTNSASWVYDGRGRVTEEQRDINTGSGTNSYKFAHAYSEGNLMTSMSYPDGATGQVGETVQTDYWWQTGAPNTMQGQGDYVGMSTGSQIGATYNANGQMTSILLGNGTTSTYTYNATFRVQHIYNDTGYINASIFYDKVGNVVEIGDVTLNTETQSFSYDSLNRLIKAKATWGSANYDHDYSYNAIGNLTSKTDVDPMGDNMGYGQATGIAPGARPHAVTHLGGSQKFWYGANGNMTCRRDGSDDWLMSWTIENQLQQAATYTNQDCESSSINPQVDEQVDFVYDADGRMVMRTENGNSTVYLGKLYQHDLAIDTKTRNYVFNGMLVAQRLNSDGNGQVKFFLADHLGSTNTTLRANGTLEAQLRYDPWGEERYSVNTTPTGYRYTGQRQDDTLGLHDYNARYYDPNIGRFISADTIIPGMSDHAIGPNSEERLTPLTVGFHETMFLENANEENRQFLLFGPSILWNRDQIREYHVPNGPMNPQVLSRYSYVTNNPLQYNDPTGHSLILAEVQYTIAEIRDMIRDMRNIAGFNLVLGSLSAGLGSLAGVLLTGLGAAILVTVFMVLFFINIVDLQYQINEFANYLDDVLQEAIKLAEEQADELGLVGEERDEFIEGFVVTIFMQQEWIPTTYTIWTSVTPTRGFIVAGLAGEALFNGFLRQARSQNQLILSN